jgi:hypothetical protein
MVTAILTRQPNTVNFVTTVKAPGFRLAQVHRVSLLDLVIQLLTWLLVQALVLRAGAPCCDNPKPKPQGEGWWWCMNCGHVWKDNSKPQPRYSRRQLYAELDRSLA